MPGAQPRRLAPLVVLVEDGDARTTARFAFLRSPVRVGRDEAGELALANPYVSSRHGVVEFDDREAFYTDLGSRNGSVLDGAPVAPHEAVPVSPGSELRIGPVTLTFERGSLPRDGAPEPDARDTIQPGAVTAMLAQLAATPRFEAGDVWASSLHPGQVIGRFELVRELGRGGFGVVYEARDRQLGRRVAFKAVRAGGALGAGPAAAWMRREAEAAAQLGHPHIVQLFDAGTWDGGPFLILELLRGETLAQRLEGGPLAAGAALRIAVDVASALAHAHGQGVVHRDLKPSNVFLVDGGWAKVLDFGLAQLLGGGPRLEGGTPRYMAPEQARGDAQDARADVYAAALVLAESIVGRVPSDPDDARRALVDAGVPALAPAIAQAISADPAARPRDGAAWHEVLLALAAEVVSQPRGDR